MSHSGWNDHWTTDAEIEFLQHLGSYGPSQTPRIELLKRYQKAMRYRKSWDNMDKVRIGEAVNAMIQAES
jgi:hypothetical protein